jgi:alkylhydroperoxidase family enzyme
MIQTKVMTERFEAVPYQDASEEVKAIYDETMKEMGIPFVLNWFKCQGNSPILLKGNWEKLKSVLLRGDVPMVLKQMIIYNISKERGCNYCTQAHGIFADSMSKALTDEDDFKITDNLGSDIIPNSYKVAVRVVTKAALRPQYMVDQDFEDLVVEGYSRSEIQELLAHADLVNMLNTIADISGIKIDNELTEVRA